MWAYPGPSYPDYPSSEEWSVVEVEPRIHKVLNLRVNLNPSPSLVPPWRGNASVRVSMSDLVSVAFTILYFYCAHDLAQGLEGSHSEPRDADSPSDAVRWEVRHASREGKWAREERLRERERDRRATRRAAKRRGTEPSPRFASSSKGVVERGATLPPLSPPCMTPTHIGK
jgi:hypothetical protein